MKTTVAITVYNKIQNIRNSILSLTSQSVLPDELILADDGSSDDILQGIQDLISLCHFPVKHVRQDDNGFRAAKNRNNAARYATGEYLVFFDQDLIFTRCYLEQILADKRKNRFYVGFPVWLSEAQTRLIVPDVITACDFNAITTEEQRQFIVRQYEKERLYTFLNTCKLRKKGPSLRSGCFGIFKSDFVKVNGFDETYQTWGYEDDDLGERLYAAGIRGFNPIKHEYPMHCYHPFAARAANGKSLNRDYFLKRKKQINRKNYRCEYGYDTPLGEDTVVVTELN